MTLMMKSISSTELTKRTFDQEQSASDNTANCKKKQKLDTNSLCVAISPKANQIKISVDSDEEQKTNIRAPRDQDVICGRGNFANYHTGNAYFRNLVQSYKIDYVACDKADKKKYSKMIYDTVRNLKPPGRFLKFDPITNTWHDIGEKKALDKTRQALREGAPEIMKELLPDQEAAEMILDLRNELVFHPPREQKLPHLVHSAERTLNPSKGNNISTIMIPAKSPITIAREVSQDFIQDKVKQDIPTKVIRTRLF